MIAHLDKLLRQLFFTRVARLAKLSDGRQIGFEPPNADWIAHVKTLAELALNVYLVGVSENLELRSNARVRETRGGRVLETRAPRRLDCHYLITAWSPAAPSPPTYEPTLDEHALLYEVTAVLVEAEPMVPRQIFDPTPLPGDFPAAIADAELPSEVMSQEDFPATPDFWSTMEGPWKPGLQLTVTLPLLFEKPFAEHMVTTRIAEHRLAGSAGAPETRIEIGGRVLEGTPPVPVAGAWVRLETPAAVPLQTTESDALGRFTFAELAAGSFLLRVRAKGFAEAVRTIDVPSPTSDGYDVQLV